MDRRVDMLIRQNWIMHGYQGRLAQAAREYQEYKREITSRDCDFKETEFWSTPNGRCCKKIQVQPVAAEQQDGDYFQDSGCAFGADGEQHKKRRDPVGHQVK